MNPVDRHNAKYRKEWDIPETGLRLSNAFGQDSSETVQYLKYVRAYITCLCQKLKELVDNGYVHPSLVPSIELICYTPIDLMELGTDSRSRVFEGSNKP